MKSAIVATIGKGDLADIRPALVRSISETNPSLLLLFATDETKTNADDICRTLNRTESDCRVHVLAQPKEDVEAIFKEMLDAVTTTMREQSIEPGNMTADFTTGMKSMSAALVLTAVKLGLGRLKYITARRDEKGKICPGGERTLTFEPAGFRASLLLDSAVTLMRQYRFDAVQQLLAEMPEHLLSDTEKASRTGLLCLADAYSHWDLFCHTHFQGEYGKARFGGDPALGQFKAQPETVRAVLELGKTLAAGKLSDLAVVDLINNARRRIEEGKYDDATARLYRACEMLAQLRLQDRGIITSDVDLSKVPDGSAEWLKYCRDDGKVKVSLRNGYRLLNEMAEPVGTWFIADAKLRGLLSDRNNSILAHGTRPATREAADRLMASLEALAKEAIAGYDAKAALLRFPWSR